MTILACPPCCNPRPPGTNCLFDGCFPSAASHPVAVVTGSCSGTVTLTFSHVIFNEIFFAWQDFEAPGLQAVILRCAEEVCGSPPSASGQWSLQASVFCGPDFTLGGRYVQSGQACPIAPLGSIEILSCSPYHVIFTLTNGFVIEVTE